MLFKSEMDTLTLFLCGDVMTGRGIDQCLPFPIKPVLHEPWIRDARRYVELAEKRSGRIGRHLAFHEVWGVALEILERVQPKFRLINLETAVTSSEDFWLGKEVHYRMNPRNLPVLQALKVNCCSLANNHSLDWGVKGLLQTLVHLERAGIKAVGAGKNLEDAVKPAILKIENGRRILVFGLGCVSSGIPGEWAARSEKPGVHLLETLGEEALSKVFSLSKKYKKPEDFIIWSIHWGGNWGYSISKEEREFAHRLIDSGSAHLIHGHSSHHAKGFEVYNGKLIFYGCGDFYSDYEGISGNESYRGDLPVMYFPTFEVTTGNTKSLDLSYLKLNRFRLQPAGHEETRWMKELLINESEKLCPKTKDSGPTALHLLKKSHDFLKYPKEGPQQSLQ